MTDLNYLKLLSRQYPTLRSAAAEAIQLSALLNTPKGTEYFFSDLHGEHDAFIHQLKSASGVIKVKIDEVFADKMDNDERKALAALIYYPNREISKQVVASGFEEWVEVTIRRLIELCICVSEKCTRAQIREKAPKDFSDITDELLHAAEMENDEYFKSITDAIITTGISKDFICGLCEMIRNIAVDRLHILGDIFDRGPHADAIIDELMMFHDVDIQWGNHDISWIGAYCGNLACAANVIRIGISYNNFDQLEDRYGINLRRLSEFATKVYADDPCEAFMPHILDENKYDPVLPYVAAKMHKAIAIIQFKLEGVLCREHPEYDMADRILLEKIDFYNNTVEVEGNVYALKDTNFPTVDPKAPLELTDEERDVILSISAAFRHSERLTKHIRFIIEKGSMYKSKNTNLFFHGCIPMTKDGNFDTVTIDGKKLYGIKYLDYINEKVQHAFFSSHEPEKKNSDRDFMWYLWCGEKSPLFGKSKLSAFENYFISDKEAAKEYMNPYYSLVESRDMCYKILDEFGLDPENSHIINGHVPVKQGDDPVKGGGSLFMIDGGISKAYQKKTGIGGYTCIFSSRYIALVKHSPFELADADNSPEVQVTKYMSERLYVCDTQNGVKIKKHIDELTDLINAYRSGIIKESTGLV